MSGSTAWDADAWQRYYEKCINSAVSQGEMSFRLAKCNAYHSCTAKWLNAHPDPDGEKRFHSYDRPNRGGHVWLYHHCWSDWFAKRHEQATRELLRMGIPSLRDRQPPPS